MIFIYTFTKQKSFMSVKKGKFYYKKFKTIYTESLDSINFLQLQGLDKNCIIKTLNPSIIRSNFKNTVNIDKEIGIDVYNYIINNSQKNIIEIVKESKKLFKQECLSNAVGLTVFNNLKLLMRAATLTNTDYSDNICVVKVTTSDKIINNNIDSPWKNLLKANKNLKILNFKTKSIDEKSYSFDENYSLIKRLKNLRLEKVVCKLGEIIWRYMPNNFANGHIFMLSTNDYAKETLSKFILRGWSVENTIYPKKIENLLKKNIFEKEICNIINDKYLHFVKQVCCDEAVVAVIENLKLNLMDGLQNYFFYKDLTDNHLLKRTNLKSQMIFLGHAKNFKSAAISEAGRKKNIPVVLFQHGIDKEIAARLNKQRICDEVALADTFVSYNETQQQIIMQNNPFALSKSRCLIGSRPKEYSNYNKKKFVLNKILYVNTLLYRGYKQSRFDHVSDVDLAENEIQIINDVLSKIPHKVVYKCYPSLRYIDRDPIKEEIKRHDNIELFQQNIDGRYIYSDYRVIVTSRATSTFGWALAANKPLIYIDPPEENARMHKNLNKFFSSNSLFVDTKNASWKKSLLNILSMSYEKIEFEFYSKNNANKKLINILLPDKRKDLSNCSYQNLLKLIQHN